MIFSSRAVELARNLHRLDLPWEPRPGHYVWDEHHKIERSSPFHDRVYFILDLKHFLRRTGTLEELQASMLWLPTWHQAVEILQQLGMDRHRIADELRERRAIEDGTELECLYELIAGRLDPTTAQSR